MTINFIPEIMNSQTNKEARRSFIAANQDQHTVGKHIICSCENPILRRRKQRTLISVIGWFKVKRDKIKIGRYTDLNSIKLL